MLKILSKITETEEQNELVFDILFEYLNQPIKIKKRKDDVYLRLFNQF